MTTIINLFGGPGIGKSTSAAYIFFKLKEAGLNSELIREYVKEWAFEQRKIESYDQIYFLGKQIRRESLLYGKVDYAVTDSPIYLNGFYSQKYCPKYLNEGVQQAINAYYKQSHEDGHKHINVFLNRSKPYNPNGRYQTESEAKDMDVEMKIMLQDLGVIYLNCESDQKSIDNLLKKLNIINQKLI